MKNVSCLVVVLVYLFLSTSAYGYLGGHPKINEDHITKDLIGKFVDGWKFEQEAPCRIKVLDSKYKKDTATVYVFVKSVNKKGSSGQKGKLRLVYEWAADDWNLLELKAISFTKIPNSIAYRIKATDSYPLLSAVYDGDTEKVKSLIQKGVDPNTKSNDGTTALMYAAEVGHYEEAKILLEAGADANAKNDFITALLLSAAQGHNAVVKLLLEQKADVNARINFHPKQTVLMWAILNLGDADTISALIDCGADINAKDDNGNTALLYSIWSKKTDVVKVLLQKGADVRSSAGISALTDAKAKGLTDIVQLLVAAGAKK